MTTEPTEPSEHCQRCGGVLGAEPSTIGVQAGRLHERCPALVLCGKCTDSFEHWLARRRSGRSEAAPGADAPRRSGASSKASKSSRSSKDDGARRDRDDQFRLLMALAAVAIIGLLLALVLVLLLRP